MAGKILTARSTEDAQPRQTHRDNSLAFINYYDPGLFLVTLLSYVLVMPLTY